MKIAAYILFFIAMISISLFLTGVYLNGMDEAFNLAKSRSIFAPSHPPSTEGGPFAAIGVLGFAVSIVGYGILGITSAIRRFVRRA